MGLAMTRPRVYLDANVFVAAFEHAGAHSDHAWWIFDAVESGKILAGTSEITLAEVLVKPIEIGATDLVDGYERMMVSSASFEVLPVRRDILVNAAALRARRSSVRLPDAVHIATAQALSCGFFISDDRGSQRRRAFACWRSIPLRSTTYSKANHRDIPSPLRPRPLRRLRPRRSPTAGGQARIVRYARRDAGAGRRIRLGQIGHGAVDHAAVCRIRPAGTVRRDPVQGQEF